MNPLDLIKQKLMTKPSLNQIEPVVISIKGEKDMSEKEYQKKTVIIDQVDTSYDFESFIKKLEDNKLSKVKIKPALELIEEKRIVEPITQVTNIKEPKKVKKLEKKKLTIMEDEPLEVVEPDLLPTEVEATETEAIVKPKESRKGRTTKKLAKGIAILGPESVVEIGETTLNDRIAKKQPPVLLRVSSYYMNNLELFVNFINSLFQPYKDELDANTENISCDSIGSTSENLTD
jgi:hypothetical protein